MSLNHWPWLILTLVALPAGSGAEEQRPPARQRAGALVATVNGQPIREIKVQRDPDPSRSHVHFQAGGFHSLGVGLYAEHEHFEAERLDALVELIDEVLFDQHVVVRQVTSEAKEIDEELAEVKDDLVARNIDYQEWLTAGAFTEEELRGNLAVRVRLAKYLDGQATEKALRDLYEQHPDWFDGTRVRFHCIQRFAPAIDSAAIEATRSQLLALRQEIEEAAQASVAKLPANKGPRARKKALTAAFAARSGYPEYSNPGYVTFVDGLEDLAMMRAIFALKPMQISEVVQVRRSLLLFLVTGRQPGQARLPFAAIDPETKEEVKMAFEDMLYDDIVRQMRAKAVIVGK